MKSLSITPKQFSYAVSVMAFSAALSGIITAGFADRFDRKKILLFFMPDLSLVHFLLYSSQLSSFINCTNLYRIFWRCNGFNFFNNSSRPFPHGNERTSNGNYTNGFAASQVLGVPFGLYMTNVWGWHAPFSMIVILGCLMTIMIMKYLEPINSHLEEKKPSNIWHHYRDILVQPNYQLGFLTIALISIGTFLMQPFASAYLINNLKVSPIQLPLVFLFTGISL